MKRVMLAREALHRRINGTVAKDTIFLEAMDIVDQEMVQIAKHAKILPGFRFITNQKIILKSRVKDNLSHSNCLKIPICMMKLLSMFALDMDSLYSLLRKEMSGAKVKNSLISSNKHLINLSKLSFLRTWFAHKSGQAKTPAIKKISARS